MADDKASILIVEDEPEVRDTLREYFHLSGFQAYVAEDGEGMREVLAHHRVDVVLMDLNLPGEDGLTLTRQLRGSHSAGVIMLTAAGETMDRIIGLEVGADDYVSKPFEPREVLARVRSVMRRLRGRSSASTPAAAERPAIVHLGSCTLDLAAHRLYDGDGREVTLTNMEFDLLKAFAENPNRVLSREQLMDLAHHRSVEVFDRSIDLRIMRIRRKIESDPEHPEVLKTVRGAGYIFVSGRSSQAM
jgi:two-component system, OmpR family, phosphate regulon response regulator OmpR